MGSFYVTCMLSGLPIIGGDRCLLFLLKQGFHHTAGAGGFSYAIDMWQPLCLPYTGVYSDSGLMTLDPEPVDWAYTDAKLSGTFGRNSFPRKYKEENPTKSLYSEDFIEKLAYHNRDTEPGEKNLTGTAFIREDVWKATFDLKAVDRHRWTTREDMQEAAKKLAKKVALEDLRSCFRFRNPLAHLNGFTHTILEFSGDSLDFPTSYLSEIDYARLKTPQEEWPKWEEVYLRVFLQLVDVIFVNAAMESLRKFWTPTSGMGSQDIDFALHAKWAKKVSEIGVSAEEEWDRRCNE